MGILFDKGESLTNQKLKPFLRGQSPDDLPIVGPLKYYPNIYINAGHGRRGPAISIACSKLIGEVMETGQYKSLENDLQGKTISPLRFNI